MTKSSYDKILLWAFLAGFLFVAVPYFYSTFFMTHPNGQNITFNVTGIVNATNSSIVSIQFECIKFCKEVAYSSGNSYLEKCWSQCANLGVNR